MNKIFLIIIDSSELINIAQCFFYETGDYTIFPNEHGEEITHLSENLAIEWINDNIQPDLIAHKYRKVKKENLRNKYLLKKDI